MEKRDEKREKRKREEWMRFSITVLPQAITLNKATRFNANEVLHRV